MIGDTLPPLSLLGSMIFCCNPVRCRRAWQPWHPARSNYDDEHMVRAGKPGWGPTFDPIAELPAAMSAFGTKRTCQSLSAMSAFGGKADIKFLRPNVR